MFDKLGNIFKRRNIALCVLILICVVIAIIETHIFYQPKGAVANIYNVALGFTNGIRMFGFGSTIKVENVLALIADTSKPHSWFHHVYVIASFIAPPVLVTSLYSFAYDVWNGRLTNRISAKKDRMLIVGYNKHVKSIACAEAKNTQVLILHSGSISEDDRLDLRKAKVYFRHYDKLEYMKEKSKELRNLLTWICPQKVKNILLFEDNDLANFANYLFFHSCITEGEQNIWGSKVLVEEREDSEEKGENLSGNNSKKGKMIPLKAIRIDCCYESMQVEQEIRNFLGTAAKNKLRYELSTFSIANLRVDKVLEKSNIAKASGEDIHLLILGFGRIGRRFLKNAINQSVNDVDNNIFVDVVDVNDREINWFVESFCSTYYQKLDDNTIQIDIGKAGEDKCPADGRLCITFHKMDLRDKGFIQKMSDKTPYSYVISCLTDPLLNLMCMNELVDYYKKKENIKDVNEVPKYMPQIVLRMDGSYGFTALSARYPAVSVMPNDGNVISMKNIQHRELEEVSYHIHKNDPPNVKDQYNSHQYESRVYRLLHYEVKLEMARQLFKVDQQLSQEERIKEIEHCEKLLQCLEEMNLEHKNEFADLVEKEPELFMLGAIEHRRWAYHKILSGYHYDQEKDDVKCTNKNLVTYREMLQDPKLRKNVYYDYKDWKVVLKNIKSEMTSIVAK